MLHDSSSPLHAVMNECNNFIIPSTLYRYHIYSNYWSTLANYLNLYNLLPIFFSGPMSKKLEEWQIVQSHIRQLQKGSDLGLQCFLKQSVPIFMVIPKHTLDYQQQNNKMNSLGYNLPKWMVSVIEFTYTLPHMNKMI